MSTTEKLFGPAANYLGVIATITPIALTHRYTFVSEERFSEWQKSEPFPLQRINLTLALELIEKAHLAAITALMRTKRWADATCLMYDSENFVGWAAAVRGFLESAGDTVDGLNDIPLSLAKYHRVIKRCLTGKENKQFVGYPDLEARLDHFVHARWMRTKRNEENVLKAKENSIYVSTLDSATPGVLKLYQKLCAICHPSNESLEYLYNPMGSDEGFTLSQTNDANAIAAICSTYPEALPAALMMSSNAALSILKVLHKFDGYPRLAALKKFDWKVMKGGLESERHLRG
jgi:hypothetical protein